jgi:hypothetical protein
MEFLFFFFINFFIIVFNHYTFLEENYYHRLKNSNKKIIKYILRDNNEDNKQIFFHIQKCEIKSDFNLKILNNKSEEIYQQNIIKKSTYFYINNTNNPFSLLINPKENISSIYIKYSYETSHKIKNYSPVVNSNIIFLKMNDSYILRFNKYIKKSIEPINYIVFYINSSNRFVDLSNICSIKNYWIELNILTNFIVDYNLDFIDINLTKFNFINGKYKFNIIAKEINGLKTEFLYKEKEINIRESLLIKILDFLLILLNYLTKLTVIICIISIIIIITIIVICIYSYKKEKKKEKNYNDFNIKFNPDNKFVRIDNKSNLND